MQLDQELAHLEARRKQMMDRAAHEFAGRLLAEEALEDALVVIAEAAALIRGITAPERMNEKEWDERANAFLRRHGRFGESIGQLWSAASKLFRTPT